MPSCNMTQQLKRQTDQNFVLWLARYAADPVKYNPVGAGTPTSAAIK
jgi:hypothetical protein